ncbi:MAG: DUF1905 domain-containing protein, partial [Actinomycetales bacterium]
MPERTPGRNHPLPRGLSHQWPTAHEQHGIGAEEGRRGLQAQLEREVAGRRADRAGRRAPRAPATGQRTAPKGPYRLRARSTCPIHRRGWGQREVIELLTETPVPLRGQIRHTARVGASFRFTGTVWIWQGDSPWHFVSLPDEIADEIADLLDGRLRGFGSVRVEVTSNAVT